MIEVIKKHANLLTWVILSIVILVFSIQSARLIGPPNNPEVERDYLISRHIVHFGERPLTGPYNSIFPTLRNSPTYPYFWAVFSIFSSNSYVLTGINLLLQVAGLIFLFLLGRRLFGKWASLIGTSLYAVSWTWYSHTTEVWQPYTMQPILLLGLWLYVLALQEKRYWLLNLAFVIVIFAGTFHYSVFALLPLLAIVALYRIFTDYKNRLFLAGPCMAILISLFLFYLPVFVSIEKQGGTTAALGSTNIVVDSIAQWWKNFSENVQMLLDALFVRFGTKPIVRQLAYAFSALLLFFTIIRELLRKNKDPRFISAVFVIGVVLQPLILSAIFNALRWQYYFIPVFGLTALLFGYAIRALFRDSRSAWVIRAAICFLLLVVFSANFFIFFTKPTRAQSIKTREVIENSLVKSVEQIKLEQGFQDYSFFQFWVYHKGNPYRSHDAEFWTMLERKFDTQFVRLLDIGNGYESMNRPDVLFFTCVNFGPLEQQECLDFIQAQNPGYEIDGTVALYGQYAIYSATIR